MHQNIIGKNVRVTKNVREHIANKMKNIKIHADRIIDANIICENINNEYTVQGTITFGRKVFHDKEKEKDLYVAIDSMFQKLERKIRKDKEKVIDKSQRVVLDKTIQTEDDGHNYTINTINIYEKPLDELDAIVLFNNEKKYCMLYFPIIRDTDLYNIKIGKNPSFLFRDNDNSVYEIFFADNIWNIEKVSVNSNNHIDILDNREYEIKEYNVSEAINYLTDENPNSKFLVYISSVTGQIEGLYKESNNSFVLMRMFNI